MKQSLFVLLALLSGASASAQTLTAKAYPYTPGGVVPDSVSLTANGTAVPGCTLATVAAGKEPTCSLNSLAAGNHTLIMTVTKIGGCTPNPDGSGATCVEGGSASSAPFAFVKVTGGVSAPVTLRVEP